MAPKVGLTRRELGDVLGLSGIFALRLLGLFLVLPVLSVYAAGLPGSSRFMAGMVVGIYGLFNVLLQVPVGVLSDRWGRKPTIALGLCVYASGSVVAAVSTGIWGLFLGRCLQGAGAISSVVMALIADLTREEVRTRAMALVGMSIGTSFALGFLMGPVLAASWGVRGIFWLIASLDAVGLAYLLFLVPDPEHPHRGEASLRHLGAILRNDNLFRLDILMFLLHMGMTSVFVVTPFFLKERWGAAELWKVYLPMILIGGGVMLPAMAFAEIKKRIKELIGSGIAVVGLGYLLLGVSVRWPALLAPGLIVYFTGFNLMEPALPSLATRFGAASLRGTVLGVFSMSQFIGSFCGGALGGLFLTFQPHGLYPFLLLLCIPWAWALWGMDDPKHIRESRFQKAREAHPVAELRRLKGVYDARWLADGTLEIRHSAGRIGPERLEEVLKERGFV